MAPPPTPGEWNTPASNRKGDSCYGDEVEIWTIQNNGTQQERQFLVHIPPSICQHHGSNITKKYPILLAFHGYGGDSTHEVKKWKATCNDSQYILVAPRGSMDKEIDPLLSWNAIDCCGIAVSKQVNDVDFVIGVVDSLNILSLADNENVVATGFSNGGFFTSLLGLLPRGRRPSWLKAIVPTGGYQYDAALYSNHVDPLPIFAHHGGSDTAVRPGGCCRDASSGTTNCIVKIGFLRDTCMSVQQSFMLWATVINGCESTVELNANGTTCWKGNRCRESTTLCLWPEEEHTWGSHMPGIEMVNGFLQKLQLTNKVVEEKQIVSFRDRSHGRSAMSGVLFALGVVTIVALFVWMQKGRKRNKNESATVNQDEVMELVGTQSTPTRTRVAVTTFV